MENRYYKIPLDFGVLMAQDKSRKVEKISEIESVDQHLELLITTCPGEHQFDKDFGTAIWEMDFERITSPNEWKNRFITYLSASVSQYEKRLTDVTFVVNISDVVQDSIIFKSTTVRKKVDIYINANLVATNQRCHFYYELFMGPLSKE